MPDDINNAITIAIDGVEIKTRPGKMVLEAAMDAGLYVPYLCYHPGMKPFAACRMCVVGAERKGREGMQRVPGFPASCTLPVEDGMVIRSEVPEVLQVRQSVMDMLIAEHPNGCLTCHRVDICGPGDICLRHVSVNDRCITCPKNERCEFKDTVRYLGMELESPLNYKYRGIPLEVADPFYDRDYNLCIVCGRCVRACQELRGDDAICFTDRSGMALVGTSFGTSLLESGCEFCGACIDVCPVGALVERDHKWEKARRVAPTICPHCPVGCQLNLEINAQGRLARAVPELSSPVNQGQACFKGKFGLEFLNQAARLRQPLVRHDGELVATSWEEALDHVASRLAGYQGDSFALLTSPNSTNEEHYLAQKFARLVMGTNNVDQTSNLQPELVAGLQHALGYAAGTNPLWDLEQAGCILVFNANLTEEHNVAGVPIKRAARANAKLVVIDPREVELTRYAHCWLRPAPGTELLVLGGILKSLLEQGLERKEWLAERCEDTAALRKALQTLDLAQVEQATHVSRQAMAEAARMFGQAGAGAIVYALDNVAPETRPDCVGALVDLALLTGNLGKPGGGLYPLRQGSNEQGAWDAGAMPHLLPGYRAVSDDDARRELEALWGGPLPATPGVGVAEALAGGVKAMLLVGDSANFDNGRLGDGLAALGNLEFLVVLDTFLGPAAQRAHVVLPRSTFAEKHGTYTNLERRIQRLRPSMHPKKGEAKAEGWVLGQLARRMGASGLDYPSAAAVMDEMAKAMPIYAGVSYQRLESETVQVLRSELATSPMPGPSTPLRAGPTAAPSNKEITLSSSERLRVALKDPKPTQVLYTGTVRRGLQWPCPTPSDPGTPVLYREGFPHGKARLPVPQFRAAEDPRPAEYPLWWVPGRVLLQSQREVQVVKGKVNRIQREEWVQLNPADAAGWDIAQGDPVEVGAAGRRLVGVAQLDAAIPPGVVATTGLFGQLAVALQTSEDLDPMSRAPGLDIVPARVAKVSEAARP